MNEFETVTDDSTDEGDYSGSEQQQFDEEEINEEEIEDLFYKNTASFRCLAQIIISRSSLLRNPLYHFPEPVDPGIDEAFNYVEKKPVYDDVGVEKYKDMCKEFNIVPISRVIKHLGTNKLDLKYYGLSLKQIRALTEALSLNEYVEELILQDNWLTAEAIAHISDMMYKNDKITYLNLQRCDLGPEGAKELNSGIMMTQTVSELDLSYNNLGDEGLENLIEGLLENCSVRKLNLSHNNLDEQSFAHLENLFTENFRLEDVDLSWNNLYNDKGMKILCASLRENPSVTSLNLSWNGIATARAVKWLARYIRNSKFLEYFDLSNNQITGDTWRRIATAISNSQSLKCVRLGNNSITPENAQNLANIFINKPQNPLTYMDLENIWVNKEFVPIWRAVTQMGKSINIGGVYSNYPIYGPDYKKLLFDRAKFLAMKAKKKKMRKDFGHFILQLPTEKPVRKSKFQEMVTNFKMKKVDIDLVKEIIKQFPHGKRRVDLAEMKETYLNYYPDTKPPKPKPKKKKKGKKGKKDKNASKARMSVVKETKLPKVGGKAQDVKEIITTPAETKEEAPGEGGDLATETKPTPENLTEGEIIPEEQPEPTVTEETTVVQGEEAQEITTEATEETENKTTKETEEIENKTTDATEEIENKIPDVAENAPEYEPT